MAVPRHLFFFVIAAFNDIQTHTRTLARPLLQGSMHFSRKGPTTVKELPSILRALAFPFPQGILLTPNILFKVISEREYVAVYVSYPIPFDSEPFYFC